VPADQALDAALAHARGALAKKPTQSAQR
jgi:hypothetical protein